MGQTGSYLESNRIQSRVKQGRIISQLGWNHGSNLGRNRDRAGSKHDSNRVDFCVEQGRLMSQTGSNQETNRVESPFERGQK